MNSKIQSRNQNQSQNHVGASIQASFLRKRVLSKLNSISEGALEVIEGGQVHRFGEHRPNLPPAVITVVDPRFWSALAFRGSIGAGEAYSKGWWTSESATNVVRLFARNQSATTGVETGLARLTKPAFTLYHALRRNTKSGSKENISEHYDLSNEFFALFLDYTMTYSCGYFEHELTSLSEASLAKIDRLCHKLRLRPSDHLLEIGTGWGALAMHAAREYGCHVTTTTISKEQHDHAKEAIRVAGLEDRITLLLDDYRNLDGQYDKIVSVEMIEAVGAEYYNEFFRTCSTLLKPGGMMAMQAITIEDQNFERARQSVDFIQRYIFPGCCIPSVTALCNAMTEASDLRLTGLEDIGRHYVTTLAHWREALYANRERALEMGFSLEFLRLWEFYFAYCEGGFAERTISTVQMLIEGPGASRAR